MSQEGSQGGAESANRDLERWLAELWQPARERTPERKESFTTPSGLPLQPVYGDAAAGGMPGEWPFARGIRPTMYRGRFWTMRQYAGFTSARETNERFRLLLESGQTGLSVAFDLPTQLGYDSDDPLAIDEVGNVGVPINSLRDMERLFDGIPLDEVSTSMTINATAPILLALYVALAAKRGVDSSKLRGTVQNDILKEYAARGNYRFPVEPSMRMTTDLMSWCASEVPSWNTISISGYHIREAGATAVQEVAFTLSNARAYFQAAVAAGLDVDTFAPRVSFFFNAHNHLFEEIAKFRCARRMWAKIAREEFGAKDDRSAAMRFHTQTAGSMLTSQQPDNNVVRVTIQALAAILGGTQSLHTNGRDEALSLPTAEAARLALRTQQILANESGVADVVDPLGGAPMIEALTDELEAAVLELMAQVDERGGAVDAIASGFVQREIHASALAWQREVEAGERPVVGVNSYQVEEEPPSISRPDPSQRAEVLRDLEEVRAERDAAAVEGALQSVKRVAQSDENLMPALVEAVGKYATLGEISGVLQGVFGDHRAVESI